MTENVEVAVVGTNLEEDVLWTVPLIDYFLHKIFAMIQSKANRPFVPLAARVALNMQLHLIIVTHDTCGCFRLDSSSPLLSGGAVSPDPRNVIVRHCLALLI